MAYRKTNNLRYDSSSGYQKVSSPKYLFGAHQMRDTIDIPISTKNVAIFDNLDVRKYYVEIDGLRYPRDSSLMNYEENDYIGQNRDFKIFFKEYIGKPILNPFISYPDMKTKYPNEIIGLRHQLDRITPKKNQIFPEYGIDPENARYFLILITRRTLEMISNGNKVI